VEQAWLQAQTLLALGRLLLLLLRLCCCLVAA
jgi:hypothetical protein